MKNKRLFMRNYCFFIRFFFICIFVLCMATNLYARTYTVVVVPWASFEVFWVAKDKGFFEKEQLDVELKSYSIVPDWVKAIQSGRFDFFSIYFSNSLPFWFDEKVANPVYLGSHFQETGFTALVVKKGLEGTNLKGKRVGVDWKSLGNTYILYKYLKSVGLSLNDIEIIVLAQDNLVQNFLSGRLHAINTIGGGIDEAVRSGDGVIVTSTKEYYESTLTGVFSPEERLKNIPKEDIKKFWRAYFSAREWMYDSKNATELALIAKKRMHMVPIVLDAYSSELNLKKYFESFKLHTMKEAFIQNEKLPTIFAEMMNLRKEIGEDYDLKFEDISDMSAFNEVLIEMENE